MDISYESMQDCLQVSGVGCCIKMANVYAIAGIRPIKKAEIIKEPDKEKKKRLVKVNKKKGLDNYENDRASAMNDILGIKQKSKD
mmetsp:Transcript_28742/g.61288  ORF Transcript_28742/g.61288 Transcript_28742/m.61288 type:complete len:85 (-) Transcript_28742:13-267(-)